MIRGDATIGQIAKAADVLGMKVKVRIIPRPKVHLDSDDCDAACPHCNWVERAACGLAEPRHHSQDIADVTCLRCRAIERAR